jgi:hypothetical protein
MDKELFTKIYLSVLPVVLHGEYQSYFSDRGTETINLDEVVVDAGRVTQLAYDELQEILNTSTKPMAQRQLGALAATVKRK